MTGQTYSEPPGTTLRFPDGHTVTLVGAQRVQVPAGTVATGGIGAPGHRILPFAGEVITSGTPGEKDTTPTGAPSHPAPAPPAHPPAHKGKQKPWQETPEGVRLNGGYEALRTAFQTNLPASRVSLQALAKHPIGG